MHRAHARYNAPEGSDEALLARHASLVEHAARRIASRTGGAVAPEDLWSAGALGLIDAARRFDPGRDVRFETFAEHRIRGAMLDELRRLDHLPRRLRAQVEDAEKARTRFTREHGREPSSDELAQALEVSVEDLTMLLGAAQPSMELVDVIEVQGNPGAPPADDLLARGQLSRAVAKAIAELPERLQLVLSLHYVEELTYREIAKILGVSEPRVCQIHSDAMARLREKMAGPG